MTINQHPDNRSTLQALGWGNPFESAFEPFASFCQPGRVAVESRGQYTVYTAGGELEAVVSGKMRHEAVDRQNYPAVGDWVALSCEPGQDKAIIHHILPRKSKFSRKAAGLTTEEQIVAANLDIVFLCMALDHDFNLRRLERYLAVAWDSGAVPVVVLTKADLNPGSDDYLAETRDIAVGADVLAISSMDGTGLDELSHYVKPGKTIALLGSSGVGKSTLVNRLIGEERQETRSVRAGDSRGRHTTTRREMIVLPQGGILLDTPGMRELSLLDSGSGLSEAFDDIESLARDCRFSDCRHRVEPGCAVLTALKAGDLSQARYESYFKLLKEQRLAEKKAQLRLAILQKNREQKTKAQKDKRYGHSEIH